MSSLSPFSVAMDPNNRNKTSLLHNTGFAVPQARPNARVVRSLRSSNKSAAVPSTTSTAGSGATTSQSGASPTPADGLQISLTAPSASAQPEPKKPEAVCPPGLLACEIKDIHSVSHDTKIFRVEPGIAISPAQHVYIVKLSDDGSGAVELKRPFTPLQSSPDLADFLVKVCVPV
jgi:hypothetical protein